MIVANMASGPWPSGVILEAMTPDAELVVIFGLLHLVALVLGGALFLVFLLRSDSASSWPPDDEDDSGGNDRVTDKPKTSPSGGIPLRYAVQSDRRLRAAHDKLADPSRRYVRHRLPEPARHRPRVPGRARTADRQPSGISCCVCVYERWTSAHAGLRTPS
jgi:hypothetical protein